jgi:hypothetical protein
VELVQQQLSMMTIFCSHNIERQAAFCGEGLVLSKWLTNSLETTKILGRASRCLFIMDLRSIILSRCLLLFALKYLKLQELAINIASRIKIVLQ